MPHVILFNLIFHGLCGVNINIILSSCRYIEHQLQSLLIFEKVWSNTLSSPKSTLNRDTLCGAFAFQ